MWMNQPVKTHAIVVFESNESARSCAKALDGARWPEETGRPLAVSHVSVDEARAIVRDAERAKREHTERVVASKNRVRRFSRDRDDGRDPVHSRVAEDRVARTTGLVRRVTATVYITRRVCVLPRLRVIVGAPDESIDSL